MDNPQLFETDEQVDNRLYQEQIRKLVRDGYLDPPASQYDQPIPEYDVREAVRFRAVYFGADREA